MAEATRAPAPARYPALITGVTGAVLGTLIGLSVVSLTPIPGLADPGPVVLVAIPLVRTLLNIAAVATIGLSLLPVLLGYDRPDLTEPVLRPARRAAVAAALVWSAGALVLLLLQTAEYRGSAETIDMADVSDYVTTVGAGKALLIVAGLAFLHCVLGVLAVRRGERVPAEARIGLALFALLPLPITGHSSTWEYHDYTTISIELHVMAAAAWVGGLATLAVLLAGNRGLLATALPRFSKLAGVSLFVVAGTGLFNAIVELLAQPAMPFLEAAFGTPYGWLVIGKMVCLAAIAVFGARMRWRLLPAIAAHKKSAFVTWAAAEVAVMGVAFGLAVVLARSPVS